MKAQNSDVMNKHTFYSYLEKNNLEGSQFTITVEGDVQKARSSGDSYVYFEDILYLGKEDVYSSYTILWTTDKDFYLLYDSKRIKVNIRDIRTYLTESYSKNYGAEEKDTFLRNMSMEPDEYPAEIKQCEYGLKSGTTYYARFYKETYYINSQEGPVERSNLVIRISDTGFTGGKPAVNITPHYQGWTY